jgi:hypothetical protein
MNLTILTARAETSLRGYLLDHEDDIAEGINDFKQLISVFNCIIGRLPQNSSGVYVADPEDSRRSSSPGGSSG